MDRSDIGWITAAALAALWIWELARRRAVRWRRTRRVRRAMRGERTAERLLRRDGYRIEARQLTREWEIDCGGEAVAIALRADLLVSRGGRRYVAEVKTGDEAPRVESASTRRQLLEYAVAYEVDGVLLVNVERGKVHEVVFPGATRARAATPLAFAIITAALAGAALGYSLR